ncbi:MAG: hypothetical protein ACRDQ7_21035, partial [Haloechinothrix sp.]
QPIHANRLADHPTITDGHSQRSHRPTGQAATPTKPTRFSEEPAQGSRLIRPIDRPTPARLPHLDVRAAGASIALAGGLLAAALTESFAEQLAGRQRASKG